MTQTLMLILLGEFSLVLLTALIVMLVVNRRHKSQRLAGIEALLEDIEARQAQRGDRLVLALVDKYQLDEQGALELSETLLAAEKQFLHGFVEQQMQQTAVSGFYESLCDLLDSYLDGMPGTQGQRPATDAAKAADAEPLVPEDEVPATATEAATSETEPPPEWGDVFD